MQVVKIILGLIGLFLVVSGINVASSGSKGDGGIYMLFGVILFAAGAPLTYFSLVGWLVKDNIDDQAEDIRQKTFWFGFLQLSLPRKLLTLIGTAVFLLGGLPLIFDIILGDGDAGEFFLTACLIIAASGAILVLAAWPSVLENFRNTDRRGRVVLLVLSVAFISGILLFIVMIGFGQENQRQERADRQIQAFLENHPEGPFVEFFGNGQKRVEGMYNAEGRKQGLLIEWYLDGQKESEGTYNADEKLEGIYTMWLPNGQKQLEAHYLNGVRHGPSFEWYGGGQKRTEENYLNGDFDGRWLGWYESGQLQYRDNFIKGEYDGIQLSWHENGQKMSEKNFINGVQEGTETHWYENGQKRLEQQMVDGKSNGPMKLWKEDGTQ